MPEEPPQKTERSSIMAKPDVIIGDSSNTVHIFEAKLSSAVDRLSKAKPGDIQEIAASQIQLLTYRVLSAMPALAKETEQAGGIADKSLLD